MAYSKALCVGKCEKNQLRTEPSGSAIWQSMHPLLQDYREKDANHMLDRTQDSEAGLYHAHEQMSSLKTSKLELAIRRYTFRLC